MTPTKCRNSLEIDRAIRSSYSNFHMGKPQILCRALGIAKPLRNGVADAIANCCKSTLHRWGF
jgi:hypothetical protein